MNKSAIYQIRNTKTGDLYVGSAVDFAVRKRQHLLSLRKGIHHSKYLQRSWNKHGASSFVFDVLEEVHAKEDLIEREQFWIDSLQPSFNVCKVAGSRLGLKVPNLAQRIPILQLDLEGSLIKEWPSMSAAGECLGIGVGKISRCCNGKGASAGGYRWVFKDKQKVSEIECVVGVVGSPLDRLNKRKAQLGKKLSPESLTKRTKKQTGLKRSKKAVENLIKANTQKIQVVQCDLEGKPLREWESASAAARGLGLHQSHITSCCRGIRKTTGRSTWRYSQ